MEDGSNGPLSDVELSEPLQNGIVPQIMANFPEGTVAVSKEDNINNSEVHKVNGNTSNGNETLQKEYSSESDALVIDESIPKTKNQTKKKRTKKYITKNSNKNTVIITHSNPYFNESLYELSQQHKQSQDCVNTSDNTDVSHPSVNEVKGELSCKIHLSKKPKGKNKPKLCEYAQYLGLQPTVQFKCSKCGRAGFESLTTLNEHIVQCNAIPSVQQPVTANSTSSFKLTRKVFLCSACGTYYENWNLYMHMLEFHRRYICLYCLGMFSVLEDLCQHIQSRHNLEPGYKNNPDEFFSAYNEPCYIVCCECNKLFSEQDNFFYHNCVRSDGTSNYSQMNLKSKMKPVKALIRPENHITGDFVESNSVQADNLDSIESFENSNSCSELHDAENESELHKENNDINLFPKTTENLGQSPTPMTSPVNEINLDIQLNLDNDSKESETHDHIENSNENFHENQDSNLTNCSNNSNNQNITMSPNKSPDISNNLITKQHKQNNGEETEDMNMENTSYQLETEEQEPIETRKVPKLSLKLLKATSYPSPILEDSDDSEKLTMEVDQIASENEEMINVDMKHSKNEDITITNNIPQLQIAGTDISIIELELEQPLDKFDIRLLLQKCLKATAGICIYCNHARKIAVNGKQLGLHAIAEHRYAAVVNSITAEELIPESFVSRIKESLNELENIFFNLECSNSEEAVTFSHLFECFQCRYSTSVHKELYLHNRKLHAKNLLLCIMCKSNFYSYSELICHLCPGLYVLDYDLQFRCCMCVSDDLPSSFRLLVHLRKKHHVCDVCLEMCHNQYKLSNHVWKHKLHHFCYRCCIAYRNKLDITRHLFWKHGTESVSCKKCLQKKWPHVYHFCVPPVSFICEECSLCFTRAVSLKVHKRIHSDEKPHSCTFEGCEEKFISKKLMLKHEKRHQEPQEDHTKAEIEEIHVKHKEYSNEDEVEITDIEDKLEVKEEEKPKPKIDVYDLPALNLSESDSSDSESEKEKIKTCDESTNKSIFHYSEQESLPHNENISETQEIEPIYEITKDSKESIAENEESEKSTPIIENIWDDFKNYQANKEKLDNIFITDVDKQSSSPHPIIESIEKELTAEDALKDHDYCIDSENQTDTSIIEVKPDLTMTQRVDHDYCSPKEDQPPTTNITDSQIQQEINEPQKSSKKHVNSSSSDSSSDSDSSSCSCGSNCSCSSSSGSSSTSSDSSGSDSSTEEGRKRQQIRRDKRKERIKTKTKESSESKKVDVLVTDQPPVETPIRESDLETTESETDEEFYDKEPQKLAKKILEEKRNQLLAEIGPVQNGTFIESTSRPPTPIPSLIEEGVKPKKKSKSKKRKKRKSERKEVEPVPQLYPEPNIPVPYYQFHQQPPTVAPITLTLARNSPVSSPSASLVPTTLHLKKSTESTFTRQDSLDSSLRASKRRRVPNKFYGYSSDEEHEKTSTPVAKWKKTEQLHSALPHSPLVVPPITIKTGPPATPQPTVEPIQIRTTSQPGEMRIHRPMPAIRIVPPRPMPQVEKDSATDSNESSSEEPSPPKPNQPQLYCYCRCPYDEVSEMIGCDSSECDIEWFHFECVGIMVPPKGQWYCPECRKKMQQRREMLHT